MKILRHGKNYKKDYEIHCKCGCLFVIEFEEVKQCDVMLNLLDGKLYRYCYCPECGQETKIMQLDELESKKIFQV